MMENMAAVHHIKSEARNFCLVSQKNPALSWSINNRPIITVPLTNRFASGYVWRDVNLTRQDLLCLLIFTQKMDNVNTAKVMGIAPDTLHKRSSSLRRRLGFENKKAMVLASEKAEFSTILSPALIDSLFDELKQRRNL
jgi:hypothetical protein